MLQGRHRSVEEIRPLADGRPYTGRQAIALHLIDQLGDEDKALDWMHAQIRDGKDLPVRELSAKKPPKTLLESLERKIGGDWSGVTEALEQVAAYQKLDGAAAILPR